MTATKKKLKKSKHVFVSNTNLIPLGLESAFDSCELCSVEEFLNGNVQPELIWLHLSSEANVASQITPIREKMLATPIAIMSNIPNDLEALASFSMAAKAYCNVHAGAPVLKSIANVISQGGMWIGESIMQKLLSMPVSNSVLELNQQLHWGASLTSREKEVSTEVSLGASNKDIALKMNITERTVKAHIGSILTKLNLKNRLQLALLVKQS